MMASVMKTRIVRIGNSKGIRIPRLLLDQTDLGEDVELELRAGQIVIRPAHCARHDWEERFKAMADQGDDRLLDADVVIPTVWDEEEWKW
jgi:antitoxin MazE